MGFTDPDTIHRATPGADPPSTWGDAVNDDLNYLYAAGGIPFSGTAVVASYVTGGVTINYPVTFLSVPLPIVCLGDNTGATGIVVDVAGLTTTHFKVIAYVGASELAGGVILRVNWICLGNV